MSQDRSPDIPVRANLFRHQLEAVRYVLSMFGVALVGADETKDELRGLRERAQERPEHGKGAAN